MITVELKTDDLTRALEQLQRQLSDMTPVMQGIGEYLVESTKARFVAGVDPDGNPWAAKSPVTMATTAAREKKAADPRPLFGPSKELSTQINFEVGPDFAIVGSNQPYAAMMQFGATQAQFGTYTGLDKNGRKHTHHLPWGNIPARPFFGLSETDEVNILDIVAESLQQAASSS